MNDIVNNGFDNFVKVVKSKKNINECYGNEDGYGQYHNPPVPDVSGTVVDVSQQAMDALKKIEEPEEKKVDNIKNTGLTKAMEMIDFAKSQLQKFSEIEDGEENLEEKNKLRSIILRTMEYVNGLINNI